MTRLKTTMFSLLLVGLVMSLACSRQSAVRSLDNSDSENPQLPFERPPNRVGIPPTAAVVFQGIPAGTQLKIRLQSPLSSELARAHDAFQAVLDEPVVVQGKIIVPRGALVGGRVVAARSSEGERTPGYLRLTLSTIALHGRSWPVETNSIFAKGGAREHSEFPAPEGLRSRPSPAETPAVTQDVRFSSGDRFTFRLKEAVPNQG